MHRLVYHVPFFPDNHGSLAHFSGQGVEKTNDIIKQIHHRSSNKIDPTFDALLVRKRLELGFHADLTRTKRKYKKTDDIYWVVRKAEIRKNTFQENYI